MAEWLYGCMYLGIVAVSEERLYGVQEEEDELDHLKAGQVPGSGSGSGT